MCERVTALNMPVAPLAHPSLHPGRSGNCAVCGLLTLTDVCLSFPWLFVARQAAQFPIVLSEAPPPAHTMRFLPLTVVTCNFWQFFG
jgi:hypothetical protein